MKKHLLLFIAAISTTFFVGCSDDDNINPPDYVTFSSVTDLSNEISVAVDETGSENVELTVLANSKSGSSRTYTINVLDGSTLDPSTYTIPATVTIPANSNEGTVSIDITGSGIDNAGDVLMVELQKEQGLYTGNPLTINIGKVCQFDPAGSFVDNSWYWEEEVPAEIVAGASENEYVVKSPFADGYDITFTVNADLTVTVPTQPGWNHPSYGDVSVQGKAGSAVSPCTGTVTLVLEHFVSAGSFGTGAEVFTKVQAAE
ncbi:MAG: hypothetical protein WBL27_03990 [Salinimicrobium sp.]